MSIEILLLCVVLIIGANIWYNNPKHCKSCHEVEKNYESWKISSHSSVNCLYCHQERGIKGVIKTKFRGIVRVILHFTGMSPSEIKAVVVRERCWYCHTQIRKKFRVGSMANLSDTHSIHLSKGYNCTDCHAEAVHPDGSRMESGMPKMVSCITCHEAEGAPTDCSTCHLDVQRHKRIIAELGGLPLEEQNGCATCHPLINSYDNKIDHGIAIENVGGWKGSTDVCGKCHPQEMKDLQHSVHAKLKAPITQVIGVKKEEGLITRYCYFCGGLAKINWADLIDAGDKKISVGCGKCHIGGDITINGKLNKEVDCLICHAQKYDMSKRVVVKDEDGKLTWSRDNTPGAASSVGFSVASNCKRCHDEYMTHYRGTPFTEQDDAHAAIGMNCTQCHTIKNHKIARGNFVVDLWANDLPAVAHSCIQCHMNRRHENNYINIHLKKLACETCHVKKTQGVLIRDWTEPVLSKKDGYYIPRSEEAQHIVPTFAWFNGTVEKPSKPVGERDDGRSKIYP
ncbi:MAG: hypothetical protein D6828_05210, partial [Nitrospirae bacterium]